MPRKKRSKLKSPPSCSCPLLESNHSSGKPYRTLQPTSHSSQTILSHISFSRWSMAPQIHRLLLASSILLPLLAISATARPGRPFHPCQTLILFSTTSSSSLPFLENPNLPPQNPSNFRRQSITVFITQLRDPNSYYYPSVVVDRHEDKRPLPLPLYSSSLRDRTKDILSVVGSLLFGVGCGALTAATMFLMWSLFAPNRFDQLRHESDDEFDEGDSDDDDVSPKKMGYVAIPAAETDSPVVVAKEVA